MDCGSDVEEIQWRRTTKQTKELCLEQSDARSTGHVASKHGISVNDDKTKSVVRATKPTTKKKLTGFPGLSSFNGRLFKSYAKLAAPAVRAHILYSQIFVIRQMIASFENYKAALTKPAVLIYPNFLLFFFRTDRRVTVCCRSSSVTKKY